MNGQVISNCGTSRSSRRTLLILAGFASICCGAPCPSTAYAQQPPVRALQSEATNAAAVAPAKLSSGNALLRTAAIRNDATINAMQFLDARRGWAVGDRGSIWSTSDGGKQWHLYPVDVTASLHSVHFIDSQTGWVAGGETDPLTHVSRGVLLMTSDGGRTWSRSEKAVLPEIHKIHFRDRQNGWAAGCTAYHFGSGLFYTVNGGRDWLPIVGETSSEYLCADFSDNRLALLADVRGNVQLVERGAITASIPVQRGLQRARAIHADVRGGSWLVGDGGLCQFSYDSGKSWQAPAGWPTAGLPQRFDLTALAVRGSKIWIAGVPGSKVFHSTDAGRNWSVLSTGQTLPLTSICFVDDQTGWAAGALGTILHTTDGGKSWTTQHSGGQRVGMLAIYSEAADVPFELVARTAGSDGYTTALLTLNRRDLELPEVQSAFVDSLRASQAINNLTGTTAKPAWQFPLRQRGIEQGPETIKQVWEQVSPTSLEEYLVMQLRSWRPDVVLTHDAKSGANRTAQLAINQTVLSAVEKAADPTQYADQLKQLSLPVWQVSKVFAEAKEPSADGMQFASVQLAPVIGQSFAEWSTSSRRLTGQDHDAPPMIHLSKLIDRVPQTAGRADLFAGLTTSGLGINRRDAVPVLEVAAVNRRAAEKRRNMQAILLRENRDGAPRVHWLAQVNDLTTSLDENSAASLLYELAERYYQTGNWEVAAETFELLVQRYPTAECSASARLWLLHYFSSTEVAWRLASTQKRVAQDTGPLAESKSESAFQPTDFVLKTVYENPPDARSATAGIDTAPTEIVSFPTMVEKRQLMAVAIANDLRQSDTVLFAEPAVRFPLQTVQRIQQRASAADHLLNGLRPARNGVWSINAQAEQFLINGRGNSPKPTWTCNLNSDRPRLDGVLDDRTWKNAQSVPLTSAQKDDSDWPAKAWIASDGEFLYLAVECTRIPKQLYPAAEQVRKRDSDLSSSDRVEVLLDIDRDCFVGYRLAIDYRGLTAESCWNDSSWNPTWYVGSAIQETTWTAEAAIPLKELTPEAPAAKTVWNVGVQRVVPQLGLQSWTVPAAVDPLLSGCGMLVFE